MRESYVEELAAHNGLDPYAEEVCASARVEVCLVDDLHRAGRNRRAGEIGAGIGGHEHVAGALRVGLTHSEAGQQDGCYLG